MKNIHSVSLLTKPNTPKTKVVKSIYYILFTLSLLISLQCSPTKTIHFKEIVWEPIDTENLPARQDYPKANAIYLLDEGEFTVDEHFIFTRHSIVKILNEAGLRYANVEIRFDEENEIHNIKGRTIRKDGTIVELNPENIHEKSLFPEFILYADSKAKVFTMPGAEVGSIIEYSYSILYKAPFAPSWQFQRNEPILLSIITLNVPNYLKYNYMVASRKEIEVDKTISHPGSSTKAIFKVKNAPAITREPFMLPPSEVTSRIYFSLAQFRSIFGFVAPIEGESWDILGDGYWRATKDKISANKTIKSKTQELISGLTTDKEKIEALYNFIQTKIRYVAIEIERGRAIPHNPSEVFNNKYGDCKDKAFLLITMLKEIGIDAVPVLTRTANSGKVIKQFVTAQQFNHVIVAVPAEYFIDMKEYDEVVIKGDKDYTTSDDYILLEPTSRSTACSQIPWYLENTNALFVKESESKLISIPSSKSNQNRTIHECNADIEKDGTLICSVTCTKTGQEANRARTLLQPLSEAEKREWFEQELSDKCHGSILKEYSISELFSLCEPLILNYSFYIPQYAQTINGSLSFSPNIFHNRMVDIFTRETREHTISFEYCRTNIEIIKIKLRDDSRIKTFLEPFSKSSSFGNYSFTCHTDGENLILNKQLSINKTRIPVDDYDEVKAFFEDILVSEKKTVTVSIKQ
ncbi:DUF3857 and transglutaminase domain-containing protein [candidate division WOR-3 bacterium]|nr:DUF3857 and transglutaminase domain-containing protein [candidate division WOR-3 bacterium]